MAVRTGRAIFSVGFLAPVKYRHYALLCEIIHVVINGGYDKFQL